jgi:hypothetical protein
MVEQSPTRTPQSQWRESPHLSFESQSVKIPGDPEDPADFSRALRYLETITDHFLEFGPLEEKTPFDVAYELSYHNRWYQYEAEQRSEAGGTQAEHREISLAQLRALSKRKLLALLETGQSPAESLPVAQHIDLLIDQAFIEEQMLNLP